MSNNLKNFQKLAIAKLIDSISGLLDNNEKQSVCVLCAPTGSGKTVMAANLIEGISRRREDEICFIWVTIGKGDLHLQSFNSISRLVSNSISVSLLENDFNGDRSQINNHEVVVVNWEKLLSKDGKTNEWKNILMKDGDFLNFREILNNTRMNRKIILIVDESHIGSTALRTIELKEEMNADVVLEISATPKFKPSIEEVQGYKAGWVQVNAEDVIDEGMIKKEVLINKGLTDLDGLDEIDSQSAVLEAAIAKRDEIEFHFDERNIDINPLVLIQIPTGLNGSQKLESILDFLSLKGYSEANNNLAIWMHGYPSVELLETIADHQNPIKFLIFKQAIDTGWDCPRAHILVKFRETKSEVFEVQIIGRILRMPETMHYGDDVLDIAYIYTNVQSPQVHNEEYNPNFIKHLKNVRIDNYEKINLPSYYKSRADYGDVTGSFVSVFCNSADEYFGTSSEFSFEVNEKHLLERGINLEVSDLKQGILSNVKIAAKEVDALEGELLGDKLFLTVAEIDLQASFNNFLIEHMGSFKNVKRSVPIMKSAFFTFFARILNFTGKRPDGYWLQRTVLSSENVGHFANVLDLAISKFALQRAEEVRSRIIAGEQNYIFEIPLENYINEYVEEIVDFKKYVMKPCYLQIQRSKPEKVFESYLENDPEVLWWFKNGTKKLEFLGIKYEYPELMINTFYPDFVVQYKSGQVGVFETKSVGDDPNLGGLNSKTAAKAKALAVWRDSLIAAGRDIRTGIVIEKNNRLMLNPSSEYEFELALQGDWSQWKIIY